MDGTGAMTGVGAALKMLRQRGFVALPKRGETRSFSGSLAYNGGSVKIRLDIRDWDFVRYPRIFILEKVPQLPVLTPHVDASREFCYLAAGSVVLDRYNPAQAIAQCLDLASKEFNRLATEPTYRDGEFQTEFGASWNIGQLPVPWTVLLGAISPNASSAQALLIDQDGKDYIAVASDPSEIASLCAVRGWPTPRPAPATCWIIHSSVAPTLPMDGLPSTIGQMFAWVRSWDRKAYDRIQTLLGTPAYLAAPMVVFLLNTSAGWFGFSFDLDNAKRKALAKKPSLMRQTLHGRSATLKITRLSAVDVSGEFVHSRNLTFPDLRDRRITLIGCGAIGGYLAQALVKLGAGTGTGELLLIDPDSMGPGNLGRHLLGYESFFRPKAEALKDALNVQFPRAKILPFVRAALPSDLQGDLVVDATGEEAVSESLNFHRLEMAEHNRPPLLHVWLLGNGECIQSLWQDSRKYGCFRCLRGKDAARTPRFESLSTKGVIKRGACQAFTPYAVSAPMSAAALAVDMIIDWLRSAQPSPRFRTRFTEASSLRKAKSQDLKPIAGCPACGKR